MIANTVLMIRPVRFGYNEQTAQSNAFQNRLKELTNRQIKEIALLEFDNYVKALRSAGIQVEVFNDTNYPYTPDSIFPNNWFSTSPFSKQLLTYPMNSPNRSDERREDILQTLSEKYGYIIDEQLVRFELERRYLEGTGAMVLDHFNKVCYAAISPRTHIKVLKAWAELTGYELVYFSAFGPSGEQIYHTNVLMCIADNYVVIALKAIKREERKKVVKKLEKSGKTIIDISKKQMNEFAGNMLQLQNKKGEKLLVMSNQARNCLTKAQVTMITEKLNNKIVSAPLNIIEAVGGGSARCMIAELFY